MRGLKYRKPYKVTGTMLSQEYLNKPFGNYERHLCVATRYGVVMVSDVKWENNFGWDTFTVFSTTKEGMYFSAILEEAMLTDIQIKWLSTNFIKKVTNNELSFLGEEKK